MTEPQSAAQAVRNQARDAVQGALVSEIESVILDRMGSAGGALAKIARIRSAFSEALGAYGMLVDIMRMAAAGYEAMTTERRMVARVASAHAFGYWVFQDRLRQVPGTPPHDFTMRNIANDTRDRRIARSTGNDNFSSDGGLTSADWTRIWRNAVQEMLSGLDQRVAGQARSGALANRMQSRFGSALRLNGQTPQQIAALYRAMVLCPSCGQSPETAAGGLLISMLEGKPRLEQEMNLRLYRQFPYAPA